MARLVTLYTLQWGDLSLEEVCIKAKEFGYDGLELGLPDHLDVRQTDPAYYQGIRDLLGKYGLELRTISSHLVGQAVCDKIDERHKGSCPIIFGETVIRRGRQRGRGWSARLSGKNFGLRHRCWFHRKPDMAFALFFPTGSGIYHRGRIQGFRQTVHSYHGRVSKVRCSFCTGSAPDRNRVRHVLCTPGIGSVGLSPCIRFQLRSQPFRLSGSRLRGFHLRVRGQDFPRPHERCLLERHT